mmetsp:Transcript_6175/g.16618  ORF Transcript_6175/g.16618 Transcript_6175/m.16618 type:complete len:260 (+) Transcript_6175:111-890(+)
MTVDGFAPSRVNLCPVLLGWLGAAAAPSPRGEAKVKSLNSSTRVIFPQRKCQDEPAPRYVVVHLIREPLGECEVSEASGSEHHPVQSPVRRKEYIYPFDVNTCVEVVLEVLHDPRILHLRQIDILQLVLFVFVQPLHQLEVPFVSSHEAHRLVVDWAAGGAQLQEDILAVVGERHRDHLRIQDRESGPQIGEHPPHHIDVSNRDGLHREPRVHRGSVFLRPLCQRHGRHKLGVDLVKECPSAAVRGLLTGLERLHLRTV